MYIDEFIGEVAIKTGITVRALHHYDSIGLLTPSDRSIAGYRLYNSEDLMQLQKIKSLQQLGFSLEEIAKIVQANIINKQLQNIILQFEQQKVLVQRLQRLADIQNIAW